MLNKKNEVVNVNSYTWTHEHFIWHFQPYNDLMMESINHLIICNLQAGGAFILHIILPFTDIL